jgi:hypothetical protein
MFELREKCWEVDVGKRGYPLPQSVSDKKSKHSKPTTKWSLKKISGQQPKFGEGNVT